MSTIPPTPVNYEEIAAVIMGKVRELMQSIPGYALAAKGRRRKIISVASLPDAFIDAVALACETSPALEAASQMTAAELRQLVAFSRSFTDVVNELNVLTRGVADTVAERRGEVGQRALRVYTIAKSINRPEDRELLIPHLANMKRTLGRGRSAKRPKAATKPVAPAPPVVPTAPVPPKASGNDALPGGSK